MENMSNEAWSRKASGLVKDLLTGLEHLHSNNMLHRDLKVGVCNVINTIITLATTILLLLASWLGKQAVPYVAMSVSALVSIHDWSRRSVPFSLIHLAFILHSLSITFAPFQSMMQLFLSPSLLHGRTNLPDFQ